MRPAMLAARGGALRQQAGRIGIEKPDRVASRRQPGRGHCAVDRQHPLHGARLFLSADRSEEHTSELQSRFGISYAVFCLKKKKTCRSTGTWTTPSAYRPVLRV